MFPCFTRYRRMMVNPIHDSCSSTASLLFTLFVPNLYYVYTIHFLSTCMENLWVLA